MLKKNVVLFQLQTSESFTAYVINVNVPRVRANADKCLQHHQGCPETPKSADVICEWPLTLFREPRNGFSGSPEKDRSIELQDIIL